MRTILVFVDWTAGEESHGGALAKATQELLTLARAAGNPAVVLAGPLTDAVRDALGAQGVQTIYHSEQSELSDYLVAPKADLLAQVAARVSPAAVLVANNADGKEVAARAGIALSAGVITDAVGLEPGLVADKSVLAGSYLVRARATTPTAIITVKPNSVEVTEADQPSVPDVETVEVVFGPASLGARIVDRTLKAASGRPDLTEARIVVAGGRGMDGDFGPSRTWPTPSGPPSAPPRRDGRGLDRTLRPSGPDRAHGRPCAVHLGGHLRRHPAEGRHADVQADRCGE